MVFSLMLSFLGSCRMSDFERDLDPEHKNFLSEVRYIITRKEKKIFNNLPSSERDGFIEQFWKKRDPDPDTETNEFKEQYYARIEEANHLFTEGGIKGWLQDRGRIYILLGPPEERFQYPTGYEFYDPPSEVWYYGIFPIIFVDRYHSRNYELVPISAQYVATLLSVQSDLKPDVKVEDVIFDFQIELDKIAENQMKVQIKVPYKNIWLKEEKEKLETILMLNLEVISEKKKVWDYTNEYLISLEPGELPKNLGKNYVIPVEIELSPGDYKMSILLENKTDQKKARKSIKFNL